MKGLAGSNKNKLAEAVKVLTATHQGLVGTVQGGAQRCFSDSQQGNLRKCLCGGRRRGIDVSPGRARVARASLWMRQESRKRNGRRH